MHYPGYIQKDLDKFTSCFYLYKNRAKTDNTPVQPVDTHPPGPKGTGETPKPKTEDWEESGWCGYSLHMRFAIVDCEECWMSWQREGVESIHMREYWLFWLLMRCVTDKWRRVERDEEGEETGSEVVRIGNRGLGMSDWHLLSTKVETTCRSGHYSSACFNGQTRKHTIRLESVLTWCINCWCGILCFLLIVIWEEFYFVSSTS